MISPLHDPAARLWSADVGLFLRAGDGRLHSLSCDPDGWDALAVPVEAEGAFLTERLLESLVRDDAAFKRNKARRDRVARRRKGGQK